MAEIVELRLERGINELLQLERVNLFTEAEVKAIIKRRKAFEYKLQKPQKVKEDFLKYIAYEQSLLKLIKVRRKKIGYTHKYKEIDQVIANRIAAIYRSIVYKNQTDIQLWFSYINFCKKQEWKGVVGSLYTRMLQVNVDKDALWIAAAKWELEGNNAHDAARKLLQRGLRHIPTSVHLWTEYFRMELMYADKIKKRRAILIGDGKDTGGKWFLCRDLRFNDSVAEDLDAEEEVNNDAILSGRVAQVVYDKGIAKLESIDFCSDVLAVLDEFDDNLASPIRQHIYDDLKVKYADKEAAWDLFARRFLHPKSYPDMSKTEKEQEAINVYEEAISKMKTEQMFTLYIQFVLELLSKSRKASKRNYTIEKLDTLCQTAWREKLLSCDVFSEWLLVFKSLYDEAARSELSPTYARKIKDLICMATERWSSDPAVWTVCLKILTEVETECKDEVRKMFERAVKRLTKPMSQLKEYEDTDKVDSFVMIWKMYAEWSKLYLPAKDALKVIESVVNGSAVPVGSVAGKKLCREFKPLLIEYAVDLFEEDGILRARDYYNKYKHYHPIAKEFCEKLLEIECAEGNSHFDYDHTVSLYVEYTRTFGTHDHSVWLEYINFELGRGRAHKVGEIYYQATKALKPDELEHFVSRYALLQKHM